MSNTTVKQHIEESVGVVSRVEQAIVHPIDGQYLHAMMGMSDEAGELMKICKDAMFYGKEIRLVDIMEEYGDMWYFFILGLMSISKLHGIAVEEVFEMVLRVNKAKLGTRYSGSGYLKSEALNRDKGREIRAMIAACDHPEADVPMPLFDSLNKRSQTVQSQGDL
jgi:hypothetical protein